MVTRNKHDLLHLLRKRVKNFRFMEFQNGTGCLIVKEDDYAWRTISALLESMSGSKWALLVMS